MKVAYEQGGVDRFTKLVDREEGRGKGIGYFQAITEGRRDCRCGSVVEGVSFKTWDENAGVGRGQKRRRDKEEIIRLGRWCSTK